MTDQHIFPPETCEQLALESEDKAAECDQQAISLKQQSEDWILMASAYREQARFWRRE